MKGDKYHLVDLPMGWMVLLAGDDGLKRASLKPSPQEALEDLGTDLDGAEDDPDAFTHVVACLHRYANGDMTVLNQIELDFNRVTPFFNAAWNACRSIPPGETRSYTWLAAEAGSPLAMRGPDKPCRSRTCSKTRRVSVPAGLPIVQPAGLKEHCL